MKISFEAIAFDKINVATKPQAHSGKDYPLDELEHFDFERLLYCLYKSEIDHNKTFGFNKIQLMSGVRENGRDCSLYIDDTLSAIIQCKQSSRNITVSQSGCAKEIIKYCLYSIQNPTLIPNINTFRYLFAASAGFDSEASVLLKEFNTLMPAHSKLEYWTKQVIGASQSLKKVTYKEIKDRLIFILQNLKVEVIIPTDINILLNKEYNNTIVSKFFEVRLVVDNSSVERIEKRLREYHDLTKPSIIKILKEFSEASYFLAEQLKNSFSVKDLPKLERKVSSSLVDWVKSPVKENHNVTVLSGVAGSGKSVILNQVFHNLQNFEIPVIAFKADISFSDTIENLEKKLALSLSLMESIDVLSIEYEKIVVIIDQIDALSQSLSANRDYLRTYMLLVHKLKTNPTVRIIISSREYDLNFDADLIPLKKYKIHDAGLLEVEEVNNILSRINFNSANKKLLQLLQTPLHLEIFCQIYHSNINPLQINSLYDLYNQLWQEKLVKGKTKNIKLLAQDTLSSIVGMMYASQTLALSPIRFDSEGINVLESEGLIQRKDDKTIQIFHQTFYDFAFARQFVEKGKDIIAYLKDNQQGLFIRSCLKMILTYLRDYDIQSYVCLLEKLIAEKATRFHIKELLITVLGNIEYPHEKEVQFVQEYVMGSNFELLFFESIYAKGWIKLLINEGVISRYLILEDTNKQMAISQLILRNANSARNELIPLLGELPASHIYDNLIARFLYLLQHWNAEAITLFGRIRKAIIGNFFMYVQLLERAMGFDLDWVFSEYNSALLSRVENLEKDEHKIKFTDSDGDFLKKLIAKDEIKAYKLCSAVLDRIITKTKYNYQINSPIFQDKAFSYYQRKEGGHDQEELMEIFISLVEKASRQQSIVFEMFHKEYRNSKSATILRVLLYAYLERLDASTDKFLETIKFVHANHALAYGDKMTYVLRQVIREIFHFMNPMQKQELINLILSIRIPNESGVFINYNTKKKMIYRGHGRIQFLYLSSIPQAELVQFAEAKKRYMELDRKFGKIKDEEPNVVRVAGVYAPYSKEKYKHMSLDDWYNTFKKIDQNYGARAFYENGSILEHSRAFEIEVKNRPSFFLPLIERIIGDVEIDPSYSVYGFTGLVKSNYDSTLVNQIYCKLLITSLPDELILFVLWETDFIIDAGHLSEDTVNFLCRQALENNDPENDDLEDPYSRAINSVRGCAVDKLIKIQDNRFSAKIFDTLERVIAFEQLLCVKSPIAQVSAYLLNSDPDRAFNLFISSIKSDSRLLVHSLWSANYFAYKYFTDMREYFKKAISTEWDRDNTRSLSIILAKAWIRDEPESEDLFFEFLNKEEEARAAVIELALHPEYILQNENELNSKCIKLFELSLDNVHPSIIHEYSVAFLRLSGDNFKDLFPLLKTYSTSKVFLHSPASFCEYVLPFTKGSPDKCIELITLFDKLIPSNVTEANHYDQQPHQVILSLYNSLGDGEKELKIKEECLDMFDKMLQVPHLRNAASKAIELVES